MANILQPRQDFPGASYGLQEEKKDEKGMEQGKEKPMPLIVLTGPTAVGKTRLSLSLARMVDGEIISADSMQVYKLMDIGSAKIMPGEMQGIRHYLIDELMPDEEFNVVKFKKCAKAYMQEICSRGKIPVLTGGTGFYIQALLYDIDFDGLPVSSGQQTEVDMEGMCREEWQKREEYSELRAQLEQFAREQGRKALHDKLAEIDARAAEEIHPNNCKRVIRAIEFYLQTGQRISEHNEQERKKTSPYNSAYFVLNDDRQVLYERINRRVDQMVEQGLVEEVKRLKDMGYTRNMVSMQGLGYKEILDVFDGKSTLPEAVERIKRDTRHFAKRQITWFKRERDVIWFHKQDYADEEQILRKMAEILKEKGIIE